MSKPVNKADFSFYPFIIIRRCAAHASVKELMFPACNINRHRKSFARAFFNELAAELPCSFFIEFCKLKFLLFLK